MNLHKNTDYPVEEFSLYAINKAYVEFLKNHKRHPTIIYMQPAAYEAMRFWAASISYVKGFVPGAYFEDSMTRFHRLRKVKIFCMSDFVMKIKIRNQPEIFKLK